MNTGEKLGLILMLAALLVLFWVVQRVSFLRCSEGAFRENKQGVSDGE